jgi:hypothetical protein
VVGITKTLTVHWLFIKTIVSVFGITKTITVHLLFIKTIVSVVCMTKTITVPFGCLFTLLYLWSV